MPWAICDLTVVPESPGCVGKEQFHTSNFLEFLDLALGSVLSREVSFCGLLLTAGI